MGEQKQATCKERINKELRSEIATLRKLFTLYQEGKSDPDEGKFCEHGLSFDYVAPNTFNGQRRGYWRYQISWGGPSDEFRFFCDENRDLTRIEYWFMDWFDGAHRILKGRDRDLLTEIWEFFKEIGSVDAVYDKAVED